MPSLLLTVCLAAIIAYPLYQLFFTPLAKIPGPLLARLTNFWRLYRVWSCDADTVHRQLHEKHGQAVRIGPNIVSLNDPNLIKTIYGARDPYLKSNFYSAMDTVSEGRKVQSQFNTRDESWHDYLARPIKTYYSMSSMLHYEARVNSVLDNFVHILTREHCSTPEAPNTCKMGEQVHLFAWDVMAEVTFGQTMGALEQDPKVLDLIKQGDIATQYMGFIGQMPILHHLLKNKFWAFGPPGFKAAADFGLPLLRKRIEQQADGVSEVSDFMDAFIKAEKDVDKGGQGSHMTSRQVSWLVANVAAGSDSTAIALQGAVHYISRNKEVQTRLAEEVRAAGPRLDWKTCQSLPYLDAVVKETFRLAPAVALMLERVVPESGLALSDGTMIPAGTIVGINPRVVNRDKRFFGPDADEFNPSRWLRGETESAEEHHDRVAHMQKADLTFGHGRRSCIGKNLAIMELYKCVARMFYEFDMAVPENAPDWKVEGGWFVRQFGIDVVLTKHHDQ